MSLCCQCNSEALAGDIHKNLIPLWLQERNVFTFFFFIFLPLLPLFCPMKAYSVEVGPEKQQPAGGRIRRSIHAAEGVVRVPNTDVHTLYDVLQNSAKKYTNRNAFGTRNVEKVIEEEKEITKVVNGTEKKEKKVWKFFQLSPYNYLTYKEASDRAHAIGAGFAALGLKEKAKIEIFAPTR